MINFEQYGFEKYDISNLFQSICDVIDDVIQNELQIVKSGEWPGTPKNLRWNRVNILKVKDGETSMFYSLFDCVSNLK